MLGAAFSALKSVTNPASLRGLVSLLEKQKLTKDHYLNYNSIAFCYVSVHFQEGYLYMSNMACSCNEPRDKSDSDGNPLHSA